MNISALKIPFRKVPPRIINPLMPVVTKRSHILKQTCSWTLRVFWAISFQMLIKILYLRKSEDWALRKLFWTPILRSKFWDKMQNFYPNKYFVNSMKLSVPHYLKNVWNAFKQTTFKSFWYNLFKIPTLFTKILSCTAMCSFDDRYGEKSS